MLSTTIFFIFSAPPSQNNLRTRHRPLQSFPDSIREEVEAHKDVSDGYPEKELLKTP